MFPTTENICSYWFGSLEVQTADDVYIGDINAVDADEGLHVQQGKGLLCHCRKKKLFSYI
jgi:hypothetical protein